MAHAGFHTETTNDVQGHVLGKDPGRERPVNGNPAHLQLVQSQALAGQHVTNLAGANPEGNGAKGAMGRGVGIATGNGHARLTQPQLRSNHVDNALLAAVKAVETQTMVRAVLLQGAEHGLSQRIGQGPALIRGGDNVIHRCYGALRMSHLETPLPQHGERLGAGHLMDEVQANEQLGLTTWQLRHPMQRPDLVIERACAQGG